MLNRAPHCGKPVFDLTPLFAVPFDESLKYPQEYGYSGGTQATLHRFYVWLPAKIEVVRYGEGVPPLTAVLPCQTGMADDS